MPMEKIKNCYNQVERLEKEGNLRAYKPQLAHQNLVPTHRFDGSEWIDCDLNYEFSISKDNVRESDPTKVKSLTFYSQNIWFGEKNREERFKNLIQMI